MPTKVLSKKISSEVYNKIHSANKYEFSKILYDSRCKHWREIKTGIYEQVDEQVFDNIRVQVVDKIYWYFRYNPDSLFLIFVP
jgi:hypothetical protein